MKPTLFFSLSIIILSFLPPSQSMDLTSKDQIQLANLFDSILGKSMKLAINPIVGIFFEKIMEEFKFDIKAAPPKRFNLDNYKIPRQMIGKSSNRKNPGLYLGITTGTLNRNLIKLMPQILKVVNETEIPFLYQVQMLLIKSLKFTISPHEVQKWLNITTDYGTNSIFINIRNMNFNLRLKTFLSLAIQNYEGYFNIKSKIDHLQLKISFQRDETRFYVKPKIHCFVNALKINDQGMEITSNIQNMPVLFVEVITMIFRSQIKDSLEVYIKETMPTDTTVQINALIEKFYRDSIDIEEGLSLNTLLTDKIIVDEDQIRLQIVGQFFDPREPAIISDNKDEIGQLDRINPGIQFGLSRIALLSFFEKFFANQKYNFIENKIMGTPINARLGFDKANIRLESDGISLLNLPIGLFCDKDRDWACTEIVKVNVFLKPDYFDLNEGVLSLDNAQPEIVEFQTLKMITGQVKEGIVRSIINLFLSKLPLNYFYVNPIPVPDFLSFSKLSFSQIDGYAFLETTLNLDRLMLI